MPFYYGGELVGGPRGPAGPDGNPIGTVISFMGTIAPEDYLVCDGSEYNVSDYPELAAHFMEQFGTASYFGGDGTTTFTVPDMRNLFLRGYHADAEEQLSGEVGKRQEATEHVETQSNRLIISVPCPGEVANYGARFKDKPADNDLASGYVRGRVDSLATSTFPGRYTSRPVNMAVLYCIKAV